MKKKLFRVSAVPGSLSILLKGQLRFMNDYYNVVGVASEGNNHQRLKDEEGIRTIAVNINRRINFWQDIKSLYNLYTLFKKEKPQIVHSITPKAGLLSMIAAYFARVPHRLHTFTGLVFPSRTGIMQKLLIFFDRVICYCATDIYPEGQGVKNDLIKYKITKKKLKIIGHGNVNGIDMAHFDSSLYSPESISDLRNELRLKPSNFVFLFVGRLVYEKGITELVNAFVKLQKKHVDIKLLLVGPYEKELDPLKPETNHEIKNNPDIIEAGWQADVRPYFALANVFVFPSYREGFPNVLLQAGAMGKFCIVTNINGSNEIIEQGINGKIIAIKDSVALENEMSECLNKKSLFESPNLTFRQMISEKYDQAVIWKALLNEYQNLE